MNVVMQRHLVSRPSGARDARGVEAGGAQSRHRWACRARIVMMDRKRKISTLWRHPLGGGELARRPGDSDSQRAQIPPLVSLSALMGA